MNLAALAFYIFATIAVGGLVMSGFLLAERRIPAALGPLHGIGALIGLGTLLLDILHGERAAERAALAFAVFAFGFLGGFVLLRVVYRDRAPAVLVVGHASLAAIGLATLYPVAFP